MVSHNHAGVADGLRRRGCVIAERQHNGLSIHDLQRDRKLAPGCVGIADDCAVVIDTSQLSVCRAGKIDDGSLSAILDKSVRVVIRGRECADGNAEGIPLAHETIEGQSLDSAVTEADERSHCAVTHHVVPAIDSAWLRTLIAAEVKQREGAGRRRLRQSEG